MRYPNAKERPRPFFQTPQLSGGGAFIRSNGACSPGRKLGAKPEKRWTTGDLTIVAD